MFIYLYNTSIHAVRYKSKHIRNTQPMAACAIDSLTHIVDAMQQETCILNCIALYSNKF